MRDFLVKSMVHCVNRTFLVLCELHF